MSWCIRYVTKYEPRARYVAAPNLYDDWFFASFFLPVQTVCSEQRTVFCEKTKIKTTFQDELYTGLWNACFISPTDVLPFVFNLTEAWLCVAIVNTAKHSISLLACTRCRYRFHFISQKQKAKWLTRKTSLALCVYSFLLYDFKLVQL